MVRHPNSLTSSLPRRVRDLHGARRAFGADAVDRICGGLLRADPPADAVVDEVGAGRGGRMILAAMGGESLPEDAPESVRRMVAHLLDVPEWVDWGRLDRGGRILLRSGIAAGLVLALRSLVVGYKAPAGNKPLVMSGQLSARVGRRLNETTKFVHAVSLPGGMRPGAEGFSITVRVRLMHAQVRKLVRDSGKWRAQLWGEPINQHDMTATTQLFSTVMLDGLRDLGVAFEREEADNAMHLWRYIGHVIGVEDALLPDTWAEGQRLSEIIEWTQGSPDEDARRLVQALFQVPLVEAQADPDPELVRRQQSILAGLFRYLNGDALADQLGIPASSWHRILKVGRPLISSFHAARRRSQTLDNLLYTMGLRYWEKSVENGLGGIPATFAPPERLHHS